MQTASQIEILILLLTVTLIVALVSSRWQVPYTLALVITGLMLGFLHLFPAIGLDPQVVLFIFLPLLLFEGAWSTAIRKLADDWFAIALLAVPGLILSIGVTGLILHAGLGLRWLTALLLGAIVSPTDPVAVLALFRHIGLSRRLRTLIEGESLFNDGVGAAIFTTLLTLILMSHQQTAMGETPFIWSVIGRMGWLMIGGPCLGALLGFMIAYLLRYIDDHLIETTVTLCTAYGAFILSEFLHTSGLLAVVGAGLVIGNYGRRTGMSARTRAVTTDVWEVIGYLANSLLFLLLGLQIGAASFIQALPGICWAVIGVLVGRVLMIYGLLPFHDIVLRLFITHGRPRLFAHTHSIPARWRPVLLFSGLRGALSLALVLSLPALLPQQKLLEGIVYGVVLVTLLGQGLGLRFLLPRWQGEGKKHPAPSVNKVS